MNNEVKELVEWVADIIDTEEPHTFRRQAILKAKQILSHPDLYIEREALFECSECGQGNYIPLAEALKELK